MPEYTITEGYVDSHELGKQYPGYIENIEATEPFTTDDGREVGPGLKWYFALDGENEPIWVTNSDKWGDRSHNRNFATGINGGAPPPLGDHNTDRFVGMRVAVIYGNKKMGAEGIRINHVIKLSDKPDLKPSEQPVAAARAKFNADEAPF